MSTKHYCDRCGAECAYRTGHLHLAEYHARAGGEVVSQDEYKPFDLCGGCIDELRAFCGDLLVMHHYDHGEPDGEAVETMNIQPPFVAMPPAPHG